jgi:hypothetical protein
VKTIIGLAAIGIVVQHIAWAGEIGGAHNRKVTVCIEHSGSVTDLYGAKIIATEIFAGIGVQIDWRSGKACLESRNAVRMSFSSSTPKTQSPGALAYAFAYEGSRIVVLYDRVKHCAKDSRAYELLAYVMVHEIAHIMQGIERHSETGIMKAHWTNAEYFQMERKRLRFNDDDIRLINMGLNSRAAAWTGNASTGNAGKRGSTPCNPLRQMRRTRP